MIYFTGHRPICHHKIVTVNIRPPYKAGREVSFKKCIFIFWEKIIEITCDFAEDMAAKCQWPPVVHGAWSNLQTLLSLCICRSNVILHVTTNGVQIDTYKNYTN